MRHNINYSGWLLALCAALGLLLSSCNRMEPAPAPDADAPAELVFSGSIDRWDLSLTKAEGSAALWADGATVFCSLKSGDNTLTMRIMYMAGSDSWYMDYLVKSSNGSYWNTNTVTASDLAPFSSGICECYYFEDENGVFAKDSSDFKPVQTKKGDKHWYVGEQTVSGTAVLKKK